MAPRIRGALEQPQKYARRMRRSSRGLIGRHLQPLKYGRRMRQEFTRSHSATLFSSIARPPTEEVRHRGGDEGPYYTILYYTLLCYAMLCYAMLCYAMLYFNVM